MAIQSCTPLPGPRSLIIDEDAPLACYCDFAPKNDGLVIVVRINAVALQNFVDDFLCAFVYFKDRAEHGSLG